MSINVQLRFSLWYLVMVGTHTVQRKIQQWGIRDRHDGWQSASQQVTWSETKIDALVRKQKGGQMQSG